MDLLARGRGKRLGVAKQVADPGDLDLGALLSVGELPPDHDDDEGEQHGVDHADHTEDHPKDLVVLRPPGAGEKADDEPEADERERHRHADDEQREDGGR